MTASFWRNLKKCHILLYFFSQYHHQDGLINRTISLFRQKEKERQTRRSSGVWPAMRDDVTPPPVWRRQGIARCCQTSKLTLSVPEESLWLRCMAEVSWFTPNAGVQGQCGKRTGLRCGRGKRTGGVAPEKRHPEVWINPDCCYWVCFFLLLFISSCCIVGSVPSAVDVDLSSTSRLVTGVRHSFCFIHVSFPIAQTCWPFHI